MTNFIILGYQSAQAEIAQVEPLLQVYFGSQGEFGLVVGVADNASEIAARIRVGWHGAQLGFCLKDADAVHDAVARIVGQVQCEPVFRVSNVQIRQRLLDELHFDRIGSLLASPPHCFLFAALLLDIAPGLRLLLRRRLRPEVVVNGRFVAQVLARSAVSPHCPGGKNQQEYQASQFSWVVAPQNQLRQTLVEKAEGAFERSFRLWPKGRGG